MIPDIRHIAFLVIPEATLLDITGPYEVFAQTMERLAAKEYFPIRYELHSLYGGRNRNIRTASGMVLQCNEHIRNIDYEIDTLFIPGVPNSAVEQYRLSPDILKWIGGQAKSVRRICSVCTGSFFLAQAGILTGRKATTHWAKCGILKRNYPDTDVESDPIFVKDGHVYTSAGISSGMDLALALVEEDMGKTFALEVARQMVLYLKRQGSQSQYSVTLTHQHTDHRPVSDACNRIREHLHEPMTVEILAEEASMSPRNFARVFVRETGVTPAKYIDKVRVETACRYLTDSRLSLKEIAKLCGLGSIDNMRKVFFKYLKISPADYRNNFGTGRP